jgi:acetolactate synthase-1/2/3 large subunit
MTDRIHGTQAAPIASAGRVQSGAEIVVRALEAHAVSHVFGVPGAKIDAVFNALVDSAIETVVCRHEQNAAFIAGGIGRLTGRCGVVIATSGPGVTNLVTGLSTATSEGDPLVALGGAVPVAESLKQVHQMTDSVSVCRPVTKYSASANSPNAVAEVMANAFRTAESGRPGAAFVNLPADVMNASCGHDVIAPPAFAGPGPADGAAIAEAARLINAARDPIVLLGLLASRPAHADAIRRFLAHSRLPVVGTFQAAGAVGAHLFQSFGGRVGQLANQPADRLLAAADLVVAIGYDPIEYPAADWNDHRDRPIVHIDLLPADLDDCYRPQVELTGDIPQTLATLIPLVRPSEVSPRSAAILETIRQARARIAREAAGHGGTPVHPLRLVSEIQDVLSDDVTLCLDVGSFYLWVARHLYSFRARQILISNGQQALGVALPWAIAASIVRPADKILSISGDGGFLFSAMELETAVRRGANIVHLVWIDETYNMVAVQEQLKYGRTSGVNFGPVDVVRFAEAFGAAGMMIDRPEAIAPTLAAAFAAEGPVVIGVRVDYSDNAALFEMAQAEQLG